MTKHQRLRLQRLLLHPSRPEALHEDAAPISASTRFIGTLDANHKAPSARLPYSSSESRPG